MFFLYLLCQRPARVTMSLYYYITLKILVNCFFFHN
jgi:hypothetical protein